MKKEHEIFVMKLSNLLEKTGIEFVNDNFKNEEDINVVINTILSSSLSALIELLRYAVDCMSEGNKDAVRQNIKILIENIIKSVMKCPHMETLYCISGTSDD